MLYNKGLRGEELEAEVRRREEEGRGRKTGVQVKDTPPTTVYIPSIAKAKLSRKAKSTITSKSLRTSPQEILAMASIPTPGPIFEFAQPTLLPPVLRHQRSVPNDPASLEYRMMYRGEFLVSLLLKGRPLT